MQVKLPIKIHNRFDIEVKDITTGEITQNGYAENIILDRLFSTAELMVGSSTAKLFGSLSIGEGTGALSPSRTALFTSIGTKSLAVVEAVYSQQPLSSYVTKVATIAPAEYVGKTITEVGLNGLSGLVTHALIKDSEGNPLSLGPKTETQEITIYATVFVNIPENSFTFIPSSGQYGIMGALFGIQDFRYLLSSGWGFVSFSTDGTPTNKAGSYSRGATPFKLLDFSNKADVANRRRYSGINKFLTSEANQKNKSVLMSNSYDAKVCFRSVFPNDLFSGYNFDNRQVGVGTGAQTVFNLTPWDEARLDKAKVVYVDGIEITSGVTWTAGSITFDTAPANGAVITVDYWVDYIPKDTNHELWVEIEMIFSEGSVS